MTSRVVVFTGTTLAHAEVQAELHATCLPPAAQGDVYRVARWQRPRVIGIVDGYFESVPSIWHKEVLWAMSHGVHVFGSASLGALRAAELADFGMEGVGAIFQAYREGEVQDDDEVAVAHAGAELAYRATSEAMVNIRATLAAAEAQGVLAPSAHSVLERSAKDLFYRDRLYPLIVQRARGNGLCTADMDRFAAWLPLGRVDQKRADALLMLRHIRSRMECGLPPKQVTFRLQRTAFWNRFVRSVQAANAVSQSDVRLFEQALRRVAPAQEA